MRTLADDGNKRAERVLRITDDSHKMLSAILIGNNIVNLSASSLATTLAIKLWGSVGAGIATGILTFLILVFGEISPKTFATLYADQISIAYSGIIGFLMKILTPVIFLVNQFSMGFLFLLHMDPKANNNQMTEEELRTMALSLYTFVGPMGSKYNLICAGVIISLLPALIVFVCCQKQIYSGITAGAVKG